MFAVHVNMGKRMEFAAFEQKVSQKNGGFLYF